jgi:hypothetical protein
VSQVLRNPQDFPPEFSSWVRAQIVRNPLVKIEPFQLPSLDKKHLIAVTGEAPFTNGWANFGSGYEPASYYKDTAGRVYLQGMITGGTIGLAAFTLPAGCRPSGQIVFDAQANSALGRVDVFPNGAVVVQTPSSNVGVSLSGLSFRVL